MRKDAILLLVVVSLAGPVQASPRNVIQWVQPGAQLYPTISVTYAGEPFSFVRSWDVSGDHLDWRIFWDSGKTIRSPPCSSSAASWDSVACIREEARSSDINAKLIFTEATLPYGSYTNINPRNVFSKRRDVDLWSWERAAVDGYLYRVVYSQFVGFGWDTYVLKGGQTTYGTGFTRWEIEAVHGDGGFGADLTEPAIWQEAMMWVEHRPWEDFDKRHVVMAGRVSDGPKLEIGYGRFPSLVPMWETSSDNDPPMYFAFEERDEEGKYISAGAFSPFVDDAGHNRIAAGCANPSRPMISRAGEMTFVAYLCGPEPTAPSLGASLYLTNVFTGGRECAFKVADLGFLPGEEEESPFSFRHGHLVYSALVDPLTEDYDVFYDNFAIHLASNWTPGTPCP